MGIEVEIERHDGISVNETLTEVNILGLVEKWGI